MNFIFIGMIFYSFINFNCEIRDYNDKGNISRVLFNKMLIESVKKDNPNILSFLMKNSNITPFYKFSYNWTLIQEGIINGNKKIIDYLIMNTNDINQPLYIFIKDTILDYILDFKKSIPKNNYNYILKKIKKMGGISKKHLNKKLFETKIFNSKTKKFNLENINEDGVISNLLLYSVKNYIEKDNIDLFQKVINLGVNVNHKSYYNEELLKIIKDYSLRDFFYKNIITISPLTISLINNKIKIVEKLLKKDAIIENYDIQILLRLKNNLKIFKLLIKYNTNFKFVTYPSIAYYNQYNDICTKTTPLIMAIRLKRWSIIKLIVDKSYINFIEHGKHTALDYAYKLKNKEIIKLLRKHGAKRGCELLNKKCEERSY